MAKLNYIFDIDCVPDPAIREETAEIIKEFYKTPKQVVYKLVLLQEVCLQRRLVPSANLFDDEEAFNKASFGLEKQLVKKLLF